MNPISITPIGIIHSPFQEAQGTPVQPFAAAAHGGGMSALPQEFGEAPQTSLHGSCGTLEIDPRWQDALQDVDGFERIWILYWGNQTKDPAPLSTPYRDTIARGIFATRVPARPNPIILTCVRLLAVCGRFVHVAELDALHGSPLIDIKPYVPLYDSYEVERIGWLESPTARKGVVLADGRFSRYGIKNDTLK